VGRQDETAIVNKGPGSLLVAIACWSVASCGTSVVPTVEHSASSTELPVVTGSIGSLSISGSVDERVLALVVVVPTLAPLDVATRWRDLAQAHVSAGGLSLRLAQPSTYELVSARDIGENDLVALLQDLGRQQWVSSVTRPK
jgi:hypothetical protein